MDFTRILKFFLEDHADFERPILLGLSGGPDSMAIFNLLISLKNKYQWKFAVAHVNHNWRKESPIEAEKLKEMAEKVNVPFHLLEIDPKQLNGNLELACRLERLKFFKNLCEEFCYQAVILGHHQDDQAETVLKRLFEGATLPKLKGLKNKTLIDGLMIWRPFLCIRKKEIEDFLNLHHIASFQDSTNLDPIYMRGRLRTKIIPLLVQEFGKDIVAPLYRIGYESLELDEYLNKKFGHYMNLIVREASYCYLDFTDFSLKFEIKHLIRMFADHEGFFMSYSMIETAAHLIQTDRANKSMSIRDKKIYFKRKKMFISLNSTL